MTQWRNPEFAGLQGDDSESLRRIFNSLTTAVTSLSAESTAAQAAADAAQAAVDALVTVPAGALTPYAGSAAPSGWLLCYGQAISRTTYATLFTAISTTYGVGDGSTTFNLPDLRARVPVAPDNMGGSDAARLDISNTLGTVGGEQKHTMTEAEMYAHTHTGAPHTHTITHDHAGPTGSWEKFVGGSGGQHGPGSGTANHDHDTLGVTGPSSNPNTGAASYTGETGSKGSTTAFNVMQPFIIMNYIIKT